MHLGLSFGLLLLLWLKISLSELGLLGSIVCVVVGYMVGHFGTSMLYLQRVQFQ